MRPSQCQEAPEKREKAEVRVHPEEVEEVAEAEEAAVDPDQRVKREPLELRVKAEVPDPKVRLERDVPETTRARPEHPEPRVAEVAIEEKLDHIAVVKIDKIDPIEAEKEKPDPIEEKVKPDHIEVAKIDPTEAEVKPDHTEEVKVKPDHTEVVKIDLTEEEAKLDLTEVAKIDHSEKIDPSEKIDHTTEVAIELHSEEALI